ncbi:hypothetical protein T4B_9009 [Trichinella pseudospiralis]|uniref:Uncharacterized protein n=1 Tax=Trichinella pseudospiralis TaxID=6337 RepID=A0A0V1IKD7_TRIPS|nr:hypothetical protein T4B_9009 [Trichinella pseudospiralis]
MVKLVISNFTFNINNSRSSISRPISSSSVSISDSSSSDSVSLSSKRLNLARNWLNSSKAHLRLLPFLRSSSSSLAQDVAVGVYRRLSAGFDILRKQLVIFLWHATPAFYAGPKPSRRDDDH